MDAAEPQSGLAEDVNTAEELSDRDRPLGVGGTLYSRADFEGPHGDALRSIASDRVGSPEGPAFVGRVLLDEEQSRELIADRAAQGINVFDEVWDGVYVVVSAAGAEHSRIQNQVQAFLQRSVGDRGLVVYPTVNLGDPDDYRVPDITVAADSEAEYLPSGELVVEIVAPNEDPLAKVPFYQQRTRELLLVDYTKRTVALLASVGDGVRYVTESAVFGFQATELIFELGWLRP